MQHCITKVLSRDVLIQVCQYMTDKSVDQAMLRQCSKYLGLLLAELGRSYKIHVWEPLHQDLEQCWTDQTLPVPSNHTILFAIARSAAQHGSLKNVQHLYATNPSICVDTLLQDASEHGRLAIVMWLAKNGANVQSASPTQVALKKEHLERMRRNLSSCMVAPPTDFFIGFDDDTFDVQGNAAATAAAKGGHLETLVWLLDNGANVDGVKCKAVPSAAKHGHIHVLKFLQERGTNIRTQNDAAIIAASSNGQLEVVQWLVEQGSDLRAQCDKAIIKACANQHLDTAKWLLSRGASITHPNCQAMAVAAEHGHLEVLQFLKQNGCDVGMLRNLPLRAAASAGQVAAAAWLLENGVTISQADEEILMAATLANQIEIVKLLVAHGANVASSTIPFRMPLFGAAMSGNLEMIQFLETQGANVRACDDKALIYAACGGYMDVAKWLVDERGADVTSQDNDAIAWACKNGHLEMAKWLVGRGADVKAQNNGALVSAAGRGCLDVVKWLVQDQGVNPTAQDYAPVILASRNGHQEVVAFLLSQDSVL